MATRLKVRKGDVVQMITGKDRGKQGRVLEARPGDKRVVVENLNMVKRHQRPRPMKDPSRMGAPQVIPGGIIEKAAAVSVSNVMVVCPTCSRPTRIGLLEKEIKGRTVRVRVCKRADCGQEIDAK
jgi:large subunit ribosomal protein L24